MSKRYIFCICIVMSLVIIIGMFSARGSTNECTFPFFPALLKSSSDEPVAPADFKEPVSCRSCHMSTMKEWEGSSHAHAFKDSLFHALWKAGSRETGGAIDIFCVSCHTPIGVLTGDIKGPEGSLTATNVTREGIHCDLCHTVADTTYRCTKSESPHNASLLVRPGSVKTGPMDNVKSTFHESTYSELHTRSEFCGNCHNLFHHASGLPLITTYEEWKGSIYAQKGIVCQDCHMMSVDTAILTADTLERQKSPGKASTIGPIRDSIHVHTFVGGNPVMKEGNTPGRPGRDAGKRLQSAARLDAQGTVSNGKGTLTVQVSNERAGHNIPTGMPGLRQVWLEVLIRDHTDAVLHHSGGLDKEGTIDKGAVRFGPEPIDSHGHITCKPWEIKGFRANTSIPPRGNITRTVEFPVSDGVTWPLTARVVLHYRGFPQSLMNELLPKAGATIPVFDMASTEAAIAAPAP